MPLRHFKWFQPTPAFEVASPGLAAYGFLQQGLQLAELGASSLAAGGFADILRAGFAQVVAGFELAVAVVAVGGLVAAQAS